MTKWNKKKFYEKNPTKKEIIRNISKNDKTHLIVALSICAILFFICVFAYNNYDYNKMYLLKFGNHSNWKVGLFAILCLLPVIKLVDYTDNCNSFIRNSFWLYPLFLSELLFLYIIF
jgi:hypothetical protein